MSQSQTGKLGYGKVAGYALVSVVVVLIVITLWSAVINPLIQQTPISPVVTTTVVQSTTPTGAGQFTKRGKIDIQIVDQYGGGAFTGATVTLLDPAHDVQVDTAAESGSTGVYITAGATYVSGDTYHFKVTKGSSTTKTLRIFTLTVDYGYSSTDTSDHVFKQLIHVTPTTAPTFVASETGGSAITSSATLNVTTTGRSTPIISFTLANSVSNTGWTGTYTDLSVGRTLAMAVVVEQTCSSCTYKSYPTDWTQLKEVSSGTDRFWWQGAPLADDAIDRYVDANGNPYQRPSGGTYSGGVALSMTINTSGMTTASTESYDVILYYWFNSNYLVSIGSVNAEAVKVKDLLVLIKK